VYTLDNNLTAPGIGRQYSAPLAASTSTRLSPAPIKARQTRAWDRCIVIHRGPLVTILSIVLLQEMLGVVARETGGTLAANES
jgi:hypothetical protein